MELVERCALLLRRRFLNETVRRHFAAVLACMLVGGSLVKELWPLPDTYLNNKRNVLNVYFVKLSWGWTFCLLLPFIALTNYVLSQSVRLVLRRLSSLLVGTVVWYLCTSFFLYVEHITGSCYDSEALLELKSQHSNRSDCKLNDGYWHGFDISGHCFLLPYCVLMIMEETSVIHDDRLERHWQKTAINVLFVALGSLTIIWVWMFFCTAIYFHDIWQKLLGTAFGITGWLVTYRWWYLKPLSPGLPPRRTSYKAKPWGYHN
ncbi:acyl-coenzyme A diphosphatase FITM2 [Spea bombifrons]|uniref:acyl-coenzyme A diphosphatase FITM2 n=1 Tax=Spea bombifrons TaxID=233779 RepID=UPI0023495F9C|nr:acyl-coenzyme A diphosphatase FITM2 [Spea bombifrons]